MTPCPGIYKITNILTGKFYIGSAEDCVCRWQTHKNQLKRNKHHNIYLQSAYNLYGSSSFEYKIMLHCPRNKKILLFFEQYYLNKYFDNGDVCYNLAKDASSPMFGIKHKEKTKKLQSLAHKGSKSYLFGVLKTEEEKKNLSEKLKGKIFSDETRQKISVALKGRTKTEEHKRHISESNKGKHIGIFKSDETRKKLSTSLLGHKLSEKTKQKIAEKARQRNTNKTIKIVKTKMEIIESNNKAKLTWELVGNIRNNFKDLKLSRKQLAIKYNMSKVQIDRILRNASWKDSSYVI